jgi:hypothetical protein
MKQLLTLLTMAAIFGSCKKKDPTPSDYLTKSKWKLESVTVFAQDFSGNIKACQKDNLYQFNTNKSITAYEGATKCNDTAANSKTDGNWSLQNADKQLSLSGSSIAESFGVSAMTVDIVTLNETLLAVKKDTSIQGLKTTINISFKSSQ